MPRVKSTLNKTSQKKLSDFFKKITPELKGIDTVAFQDKFTNIVYKDVRGIKEGNEKKMYDDASDFVEGKALVITDGVANLIDENFEVVQEVGPADSVAACGSLFTVTTGEEKYLYVIK